MTLEESFPFDDSAHVEDVPQLLNPTEVAAMGYAGELVACNTVMLVPATQASQPREPEFVRLELDQTRDRFSGKAVFRI